MNLADGLLRGREDPEQSSFLELFFDLVYVFAFTRVSQRLLDNIADAQGAAGQWSALAESGKTLLLLFALLWVWLMTVATTAGLTPRRAAVQVVVIVTMVAALVMGISIPGAFEDRGLAFAGAYVLIQVRRAILLGVVLRRHPLRRGVYRALLWLALSGSLWLAGGLSSGATRTALWVLGTGVDFVSSRLIFPQPAALPARRPDAILAPEHLADRFRELVLIALGESILIIGLTLSGVWINAPTGSFLVALATTVLLWRIYFYRAGKVFAGAIAVSRKPLRLSRSVADTHVVMVTGIVATAVGYEIVITRPTGPTQPVWLAVILGGPALFLAGRARFENVVFGRVSWSRLIGIVVLAVIAPAMTRASPLAAAGCAAAVLLGIAVSDSVRAWRRPGEEPSPPI